jgi:hypothetical protein
MPVAAVIGAVASAAISGGMAWATGMTIFGLTGFAAASAIFGVSLIGSLALSALQSMTGSEKPASQIPFVGEAQSRTQMVRSSIMNRRIVIGRVVTSGPLVFAASHASTPGGPEPNSNLTLVIVLAAHQVSYIGEIFLNDVPATDPRFAGRVGLWRYYGTNDQSANERLISFGVGWTPAHRLLGLAYIIAELWWDQNTFPTGIPNIKAEVWGLPIYDPRINVTAFTNNTSLVARAYLLNQDWGLHAEAGEIDDGLAFLPSADVCDQYIEVLEEGRHVYVLDPPSGMLFMAGDRFALGIADKVRIQSTGTVPTPLTNGATYFAIPTSIHNGPWPNGILLADSLVNARQRSAIPFSAAGSGTISLYRTHQLRYQCNGVIDTGKTPKAILDAIMTSDAGVIAWQAGLYRHFAGSARASSFVLTASDLRGPIGITPTLEKQKLANQIFGTYIDPINSWQPSDFDAVKNTQYIIEDSGEPIRRDIELNFTTDGIAAQRIARVHLEASRQGQVLAFPAKTIGLSIAIWDVGQIYIPDAGYAGKLFQCVGWSFTDDAGFDLDLREYADAIYEWNKGYETRGDIAPDTTLPSRGMSRPRRSRTSPKS